jgi:CubicO group peptidase (beta-lactamase class C family)
MPSLRPRRMFLVAVLSTLAALVPLAPAAAQPKKELEPKSDAKLAEKLTAVRQAQKVPAVWGAVIEGDKLLAVAAVGVRKTGEFEPVTINDLVHIGSDTKAMTATMIALLVEKKKLKWTSTIGQVLPDLKGKVHADYLNVTIAQLVAHQGGVIPNVDWWSPPKDMTTREQRAWLLPVILKDSPADKPGTKYVYSNASIVVAGAMAEEAANASWESLMTDSLFKPLGMKSAGFGAPGKKGEIDQPWGHKLVEDELQAIQGDNAPCLGPAGTVHASFPDWAKFAILHLQGAQGRAKLLKPASFAALQTPVQGFNYSGGWIVAKDGSLSHDGNNTMWYARIRIQPKQNLAVLAAVNLGGDEGRKAVVDAEKAVNEYYRNRLGKR